MNFRGSLHDSMRGFTLVELMVVITVMAVLATIAAPSVTQLLASRRMKSAAFELQSSLLQARSFAATYGRPVGMFPAYSGGWNVLSANRGATINLPNSGDVSAPNLKAAQLSWYVVTPGEVSAPLTTGAISTMANSTANNYPIRVSLPDQTLITATATPVAATSGICFFPAGYAGTPVVSGSNVSCSYPAANNYTQISFRVCDSASNIKGKTAGYTVMVGPFGTVRTYTGDPVGGTSC